MTEQSSGNGNSAFTISTKDILGIGFRHKRMIGVCFSAIVLGAVLVGILLPASYKAHTKLLLRRERIDPVVSPGQETQMLHDDVSQEDLNSEVELLESDDVLRQVVVACGLQNHHSWHLFRTPDADENIAKATARLRGDLQVEALAKTNLISISYTSDDPRKGANVLKNLNDIYIQKNAEVHRPHGQYKFFEQETERYNTELKQAEQQLKQFASERNGVAPQVARDNTLQRLAEFTATLEQTRAEMAATEEKIHTLEKQADKLPARIMTQLHESDDAPLLQTLKTSLMNLELKRTELLTKYQPTYPLVQEVEKQITDTRAAIATAATKPVRDETTDENPTYQYVSTELVKAKADFSAEQARAAATQTIVAMYRAEAEQLEQKGIVHQDLLRAQKADEDNFLLYQKKREEARMADALDERRILNVAVVEQPFVPVIPVTSPFVVIGFGLLIAVITSAGMALAADFVDPSFRTPSEVLDELNIPVLAAVPYHRAANGRNGNGNGNGNGNNGRHNGSHGGVSESPAAMAESDAGEQRL
jgi:uncharacterized protein involved in exopolysaccharide biosynthesis